MFAEILPKRLQNRGYSTLKGSKGQNQDAPPSDVATAQPPYSLGRKLVFQLAFVNFVIESVTIVVLPLVETLQFGWLESLLDASVSTSIASVVIYHRILVPVNGRLSETLRRLEESRSQAERSARLDPLTEIPNRRHFFEQARNEWSRQQRTERPLSCVILDIDHFKRVNDDHGHAVGDAVIRGVAHRLEAICRAGDVLCRYGGEEFCVLLPETDLQDARLFAERVRRCIADQPISTVDESFSVTVSVGVAAKSDLTADLEQLIHRADHALLQAKAYGRNCVVAADRPQAA